MWMDDWGFRLDALSGIWGGGGTMGDECGWIGGSGFDYHGSGADGGASATGGRLSLF